MTQGMRVLIQKCIHSLFLNIFATLSSQKWRRTKRRPQNKGLRFIVYRSEFLANADIILVNAQRI